MGPAAGGAVFVLVFGMILYAPAEAGRIAWSLYEAFPPPGDGAKPEAVSDFVRSMVDQSVQYFALGDADKLVDLDLRLRDSQPQPGEWYPNRTVALVWNDLGSDGIRYAIRVGPVGTDFGAATLVGEVADASAVVPIPGDGSFTIWVQARARRDGDPGAFGPFNIDATPPPAPLLADRADPPGYRFELSWSTVTDVSGVVKYELERNLEDGAWETLGSALATSWVEDQVGNGRHHYRVRAVNAAGLRGPWSNEIDVDVRAPMANPGPGQLDYGIHANYTGFLYTWDLSDPDQYLELAELPADVRADYLGAGPAIEIDNTTLRSIVEDVAGPETNTLRIAEALFIYLFETVDYDSAKLDDPEGDLQRAGLTLDRGKGICGDLAVLYITLLRIAGVPARPMHGYLDNPRANVGGFHMWVEVYVGPTDASHPWMTVDVSGVTGPFEEELLYGYFGVFNPDYLALGEERNYNRYLDEQWNTWARFRYVRPAGSPAPEISDSAKVTEYETELGRLFFNTETRRTKYVACQNPDVLQPDDPCHDEPLPEGFNRWFGAKGVSKKRIDYGARLDAHMPSCLRIEIRYPFTDAFGRVVRDQSSIYRVYEGTASSQVSVDAPDEDGWVRFLDGTDTDTACSQL